MVRSGGGSEKCVRDSSESVWLAARPPPRHGNGKRETKRNAPRLSRLLIYEINRPYGLEREPERYHLSGGRRLVEWMEAWPVAYTRLKPPTK